MDVHASREFYEALGIESIPLWPGTKVPLAEEWPTKPVAQQWANAAPDANLGMRHRGREVNIEADNRKDPRTFERIMRRLTDRGVTQPVVVKSASVIGRHVYLACPDAPSDIAYRNLSPEIGAGELRIGIGAMSVLPDSWVTGVKYELLSGDWRVLPIVQWRDVLWLLPLQRVFTYADSLLIRLNRRPMSRGQADLFDAIARAGRGEMVRHYPSRSEAEAAIVSASILNGWSFDDIRLEFRRRDVGHFHDAKRHADRYLETTYSNALAGIMASKVRQLLAASYEAANYRAWPGKSGNSDRATFLAVLAEGYRAGAAEASVSLREISEYAAIGIATSQRALRRLAAERLIKPVKPASEDGRIAAVYRVPADNGSGVTEEDLIHYRQGAKVTSDPLSTFPELASRSALGRSTIQVYEHIDAFNAQSITSLVSATGRARSTVTAALVRLAEYGLAVQTDGGNWIQGPNDLATVAGDLNCHELAAARRERHANDRARYQRIIEMRKDHRTGS